MPTSPKKKQRPWIATPKQNPQDKHIYKTVYNTNRWRKLRQIQLNDQPLCEECKKENITTAATVVDHVIRIKDGGSKWSLDNLQSLCTACHNRKRQTERQTK